MKENQVATALYRCLKPSGHIFVPRSTEFLCESDFLHIKPTGRTTTYEIKVSRSDFFADFKKPWHYFMADPVLRCYENGQPRVPNQFYFATPADLVTKEEVPEYAGLCYVSLDPYRVDIVKRAPLLHQAKLADKRIYRALRILHLRYWDDRLYGRFQPEARHD